MPPTIEQRAEGMARTLRRLSALARARVMNVLYHKDRELFAAVMARPPRAGESPFDSRR